VFGFNTTFAANKSWTGSVSTSWAEAGNWNPSGVPADADDIIIPSSCTYYPIILNNRKAKSITINTGGSITFQSGTFTVNGGGVSNSGSMLISGGTLDIQNATGNLINSGSLTISSGQLKVGNTFTNNAGYNFYVSGGTITANITNYGTVTSSSGSSLLNGIIANQSGSTVNINGGNLEVTKEPSTNAGTISVSSGTLFFNGKDLNNLSGGTITQTGGSIELDHLTNSGQVTASGGTFTIDEFFTNNSGCNINVNGGSIIVKNNTSINYGSVTVSSGLLDFGTAGRDFTIASGGSVNQTGGTVKVKKLTVAASASYTFSGTTLDISGDLVNSGTVTLNPGIVNVAGQIQTEVGSNFTISGATVTAQNDATFKGTVTISSGTLDFGSNNKAAFIDGSTFNQYGGTIITENLELKNGSTYNQTGGELQVDHDLKIPVGTTFNSTGGTVRFTGEQGGGAEFYGNVQFHNVVIDAGASLNMDNNNDNIKISGNFTNNNPDLDNDKGTVTFNGTASQTIYSASTPPGSKTTFGNLVVSNPNGVTLLSDLGVHTSISFNSGGYINPDDNTIYLNGSVYNGPLPVELSSFSASVVGNAVKLNWRTETEVNNYGFEIERYALSAERQAWEEIGFVNGNGNSNSPKSYFYEDKNVTAGKYSYRLKQIDNDGQFEYSKTIEVDLGAPKKFELSQNYPNPFNPTTTIRFNLPEAGNVKLTLFNILGQEIKTLVNEFKESGVHTINFDASELNSGMYIYKLEAGSFVQTRKMTLVK
jgi:hypothetical protein